MCNLANFLISLTAFGALFLKVTPWSLLCKLMVYSLVTASFNSLAILYCSEGMGVLLVWRGKRRSLYIQSLQLKTTKVTTKFHPVHSSSMGVLHLQPAGRPYSVGSSRWSPIGDAVGCERGRERGESRASSVAAGACLVENLENFWESRSARIFFSFCGSDYKTLFWSSKDRPL